MLSIQKLYAQIGRILALLCVFALSLWHSSCTQSTEPEPTQAPRLRGISYTSFGSSDFQSGSASQQLLAARNELAADIVALNVFLEQDSINSTSIHPSLNSSTDADILQAIRDARANSMRVMLKVNIDVHNGPWRGYIVPDNQGQWFAAYTNTMQHYAQLAESQNVEYFCIGCELIRATSPEYDLKWRQVISTIRGIYHGKLTYAANWNGLGTAHNYVAEFEQIGFWDALDYIGVDIYQPVASSDSEFPMLSEAVIRLSALRSSLQSIANQYAKTVIVCESGAQSVHGCLSAPYDYSKALAPGALEDDAAQNLYIRAIIGSFGVQPWCEGVMWWNWESVQSTHWNLNYTPRQKTAATTIRNWYRLPS